MEKGDGKMKLKVGDKVRVRKDLIAGHFYDYTTSFIPDMRKYMGKIATIRRKYSYAYSLDIDGGCWNWSESMLEPAKITNWKEEMGE